MPEWRGKHDEVPLVWYLVPWLAVVAVGVKIKITLLTREGGGYDLLAELSGLPNRSGLGTAARLGLVTEDLVIPGVVGSLALLAALRLIPRRARSAFVGAVSVLVSLVLYIELKCYWELGSFLPAPVLAAGILGSGRQYLTAYLFTPSNARLLVVLLGVVTVTMGLYVAERRVPVARWLQRGSRFARAGLLGGAFMATALLSLRTSKMPFSASAVTAALGGFAGIGSRVSVSEADLRELPADSALHRYAQIAKAPVPNARSAFFGRARGNDVIVLLLESLPATCAEVVRADSVLPHLRALRSRAFVMRRHYATYPYSRRAYLSIFASWYPRNGIRDAIGYVDSRGERYFAPGVVRSAALTGYETAAFVPEKPQTFEFDEERYRALGFQEVVTPPSVLGQPDFSTLDVEALRAQRQRADRETFDRLKERVRQANRENRRFLYSFNPQGTHGPWPGVEGLTNEIAACQAGIGVYQHVDSMLGELLAQLRAAGRLERTLVLALGDHGLRTRREFPPFNGGTLDDITFRVPSVLWAPSALDTTYDISWVTSHIDVAPSLLDLLGIEQERSLEMGSPFWDQRLAHRRTYVLARSYLGADGFMERDESVMLRYTFGGVARTTGDSLLRFQARDLVTSSPDYARAVSSELYLLAGLQDVLLRTMTSRPAPATLSGAGAVPP